MRLRNSASSASGTLSRKGRIALPSVAAVERAGDEDAADIVVLLDKRARHRTRECCHCNGAGGNVSQEEVTLLLLQQFSEMESDRCSKILRNDVGERRVGRRQRVRARGPMKSCASCLPQRFWEDLMSRYRLAAPYGKSGKSLRSGSNSKFSGGGKMIAIPLPGRPRSSATWRLRQMQV